MPEEFVAVAASSGLASELARRWLGRRSSRVEWRRISGDLGVSVNLPARAFADTSAAGDGRPACWSRTACLPGRLTLEIAESSVVAERSRTLPVLRQLVELGVRIAVDGFGTGHSSLTHLRRMPIGQVRIDARFVRRIDQDRSDEAIVRSIVDLGAKLGLDVVAEGVDRQRGVGDSCAAWGAARRRASCWRARYRFPPSPTGCATTTPRRAGCSAARR